MNTAITKEEYTKRKISLDFSNNAEYVAFIVVLAASSRLQKSQIAFDLFEQEREAIAKNKILSDMYDQFVQ